MFNDNSNLFSCSNAKENFNNMKPVMKSPNTNTIKSSNTNSIETMMKTLSLKKSIQLPGNNFERITNTNSNKYVDGFQSDDDAPEEEAEAEAEAEEEEGEGEPSDDGGSKKKKTKKKKTKKAAKKLCINKTCVTEKQLKALIKLTKKKPESS